MIQTLCIYVVFCLHCWTGSGSETASRPGINWVESGQGVHHAVISGAPECQFGPDTIHMIRFDPSEWRFTAHYFRSISDDITLSADGWREILNAPFVINAGQYNESFQHLGWLVHHGNNAGTRQHRHWKAIFLSEPKRPGIPITYIHDLTKQPLSLERLTYSEAVQTIMLFDENRKIRVKNTEKLARRSIIADTSDGKILFIVSDGKYTLWAFAGLLIRNVPDIRRAATLDGGAQAQLSAKYRSLKLNIPAIQISLPAVIAAHPRNPENE